MVQGLNSKNPEIFGKLYEQYSPALFGIIKRIVVNQNLAEEVLHDVFMRIWNNSHLYDPQKGRLFTWMLNISRNMAIDKTRSRKFKEGTKTDAVASNVYTIDKQRYIEQNPDDIGVKDLLLQLNEDQRMVLDLLYFKGYSQSEVASEFQIPLGTVKTRTRAALLMLRKILKK